MSEKAVTVKIVGILDLLAVAFIVLKLCHVINWSWWLVTLPIWGGLALILGIFAIAFCLGAFIFTCLWFVKLFSKRI